MNELIIIMRPSPSPAMFDEMNADSFTSLMHVYVVDMLGTSKGFIPGPPHGTDKGVDAGIRISDTVYRWQYKFHTYNGRNATDKVIQGTPYSQFKKWLKEAYEQYGGAGPYVFATNVMRNQTYIDKCEEIIQEYREKGVDVYYVDHQQIVRFFDAEPSRYQTWIPNYSSGDIGKRADELKELIEEQKIMRQQEEKEAKERYALTEEFSDISRKFGELTVDKVKLKRNYLGSIYLFYPIYVDNADGSREILKNLFHITHELEEETITGLMDEGKIDITGNFITAPKTDETESAATELVDFMGDDLQKVLNLLQRDA